jgi:microcystin degradation protein MlrC
MAREATLIAFRTYPHIDMHDRALQGAALLDRAMRGEIRPRTVLARRPTMRGFDNGRTQAGPMAAALARGAAHEAAGEALVVSACAGFTRADIADVGPTVTVTTDGDDPRGREIAEALMDFCWATRGYSTTDLRPVEAVVALALAGQPGDKPLVIADYTDNPGGGGYGDATNLLRGLLEAGAEGVVLHALYDPAAVQAAIAAGIGATATIAMGGKTDPSLGGGPLTLTGQVSAITDGRLVARGPMGGGLTFDYGPSVRFTVGGIEVILISNNGQAKDLAQITSMGIDPRDFRTVCVKSMHHFRAAFEPIARQVVLVDSGALCSERFTADLFPKARRPIWPIDPLE